MYIKKLLFASSLAAALFPQTLTEVYFHSSLKYGCGQWFEIYNNSPGDIHITELTASASGKVYGFVLPDFELPQGSRNSAILPGGTCAIVLDSGFKFNEGFDFSNVLLWTADSTSLSTGTSISEGDNIELQWKGNTADRIIDIRKNSPLPGFSIEKIDVKLFFDKDNRKSCWPAPSPGRLSSSANFNSITLLQTKAVCAIPFFVKIDGGSLSSYSICGFEYNDLDVFAASTDFLQKRSDSGMPQLQLTRGGSGILAVQAKRAGSFQVKINNADMKIQADESSSQFPGSVIISEAAPVEINGDWLEVFIGTGAAGRKCSIQCWNADLSSTHQYYFAVNNSGLNIISADKENTAAQVIFIEDFDLFSEGTIAVFDDQGSSIDAVIYPRPAGAAVERKNLQSSALMPDDWNETAEGTPGHRIQAEKGRLKIEAYPEVFSADEEIILNVFSPEYMVGRIKLYDNEGNGVTDFELIENLLPGINKFSFNSSILPHGGIWLIRILADGTRNFDHITAVEKLP